MKFALVFAALAALSGCSAVSALTGSDALEVYELRRVDQPQAGRQSPDHVIIETPSTTGALDTDRIMIKPNALQAQYLPGARWSDATPVMLQTLMLRSVQSTDAFSYVGRQPLGARGDYAVLTELVDFQTELDATGETATVRLGMTVRVLREDDNRIIASRDFAASAVAPSTETLALVAGFDAAAATLLDAFASWTLSVIAAD